VKKTIADHLANIYKLFMSALPNSYFSGANLILFGSNDAPTRVSMKEDTKMNNANVGAFPTSQRTAHGKVRMAILNPVLCTISATLGIFGGISSLVGGLVCITIHLFVDQDVVFDRAGTTLLILGIPLLLLGSIFLDEIEPNK